MPAWDACEFEGQPVEVIDVLVRWWPVPGENVSSEHPKRGVNDEAASGAFNDPTHGGRPSLVLIDHAEY